MGPVAFISQVFGSPSGTTIPQLVSSKTLPVLHDYDSQSKYLVTLFAIRHWPSLPLMTDLNSRLHRLKRSTMSAPL